MRKFKKFACMSLVAMSLMLGACAKTGNSDVKSTESTTLETTTEATQETETTTEETTTEETTTIQETTTVQETTVQETTTEEEETFDCGLAEFYKDYFKIGVALPSLVIKNTKKFEEPIVKDYNSITCENEMKPDALLDKAACQADLENTYTNPAVKFNSCKAAIDFAIEHDMQIRLHTLVWHSQTPKWFFTEDYTDNGELVSREVMLVRMENYIKNVLTYFNENYPGLIYAVDVCNEAFDDGNGDENGIRMKDNLWYSTVGPDYYYQAFVFARKYAGEGMKLFYNDYGCMSKYNTIIKHLAQAKEEGLIDGIGMQSHLSITDDVQFKFKLAVKKFLEAGYELQITELDIGMEEVTELNLYAQARKYKLVFQMLKEFKDEGYNVSSVTLWGIDDNHTWREGEFPLLYDKDLKPKKAYAGAMLSSKIPAIN